MKKNVETRVWRAAFKSSIPVLCGFITLGAAYGLLMNSYGYNLLHTGAASLFVFAGSAQFLMAGMLAGGATVLEIAIAVALVNARHMVYGLSLLNDYARAGKYRFFMIYELCDEAYAILSSGSAPQGADRAKYNFCVELLCHSYWIAGSVLGAALGMMIPFNTKGLDFALTALFLTILTDQLRAAENRLPALIGGICAVAMRFILPQNMLLGAMPLALAALYAARPALEKMGGGERA